MIIDHQIFRTSIIERETHNYMGEGLSIIKRSDSII